MISDNNLEKNRQTIVDNGGLELIIEILKNKTFNAQVHAEACRTLYNLARNCMLNLL